MFIGATGLFVLAVLSRARREPAASSSVEHVSLPRILAYLVLGVFAFLALSFLGAVASYYYWGPGGG